MRFGFFQRHSLKTRVTLFTLVIFVLSLWSLLLFAERELRIDMQQMISQQQNSAATLLSNEVSRELSNRMSVLEQLSSQLNGALMASPAALQVHLENRLVIKTQFNGGAMVLNQAGQAIAEVPRGAGRTGLNYMDCDYARSVLLEGKSAYGSPVEGRAPKHPLINFAVPIRNDRRQIVGALVGITDLSRPGFLTQISEGHYGQTGGYLLVDPRFRRVVTATDHRRILEQLPAPDKNPAIDRFLSGFNGTQSMRNPMGVDILATNKTVAATGWIVAVVLPVEEAFAPLLAVEKRMFLATSLLTVLATFLTWLMIHHQLEPIESTIKTLAQRVTTGQNLTPLDVTRHDEIGELISSFNTLLSTIWHQQREMETQQTMLTRAETAAHLGSWQWNMATDQVTWSPEMYRIFGLAPTADAPPIAGQTKYFSAIDMERLQQAILAAKRQYGPYETELSVVQPDGSSRFCIARFQVQLDDVQQVTTLYGSFQDVTEAKQAQLKLELAAKVFSHALEGITITDVQGTILNVNNAFCKITGYNHEEVIGQNPRILKSGRQDASFYETLWQTLLSTDQWSGEIWNRRKNGEIYPELLHISAVRDTQGQTQQFVALFSDITQRKSLEEKLQQLAFVDMLTQLPNRRLLEDRIAQALHNNKRSGHFGALMYLDLDNFKPLNDTHGHAVGDLLLIEVAKRLKNCVREVDTVARMGGDEFVVVLSALDTCPKVSREQAQSVAEKIRTSLAQPYQLAILHPDKAPGTVRHECTCSIGVALLPTQTADYHAVMKLADAAMYRAKDLGRNLVVFD